LIAITVPTLTDAIVTLIATAAAAVTGRAETTTKAGTAETAAPTT
jgi:hypothetical protein